MVPSWPAFGGHVVRTFSNWSVFVSLSTITGGRETAGSTEMRQVKNELSHKQAESWDSWRTTLPHNCPHSTPPGTFHPVVEATSFLESRVSQCNGHWQWKSFTWSGKSQRSVTTETCVYFNHLSVEHQLWRPNMKTVCTSSEISSSAPCLILWETDIFLNLPTCRKWLKYPKSNNSIPDSSLLWRIQQFGPVFLILSVHTRGIVMTLRPQGQGNEHLGTKPVVWQKQDCKFKSWATKPRRQDVLTNIQQNEKTPSKVILYLPNSLHSMLTPCISFIWVHVTQFSSQLTLDQHHLITFALFPLSLKNAICLQ